MAMKNGVPMHAMYLIVFYDHAWNEVPGLAKLHTAGEMLEVVERWNRTCQKDARDPELVVMSATLPAYMSIEVRYVER